MAFVGRTFPWHIRAFVVSRNTDPECPVLHSGGDCNDELGIVLAVRKNVNCKVCGKETNFAVERGAERILFPVCGVECWNIHMAGGGVMEANTPAKPFYPTIGRNKSNLVAAVPPDEPIGSADETIKDERKQDG